VRAARIVGSAFTSALKWKPPSATVVPLCLSAAARRLCFIMAISWTLSFLVASLWRAGCRLHRKPSGGVAGRQRSEGSLRRRVPALVASRVLRRGAPWLRAHRRCSTVRKECHACGKGGAGLGPLAGACVGPQRVLVALTPSQCSHSHPRSPSLGLAAHRTVYLCCEQAKRKSRACIPGSRDATVRYSLCQGLPHIITPPCCVPRGKSPAA
jgi:hypothetical protein